MIQEVIIGYENIDMDPQRTLFLDRKVISSSECLPLRPLRTTESAECIRALMSCGSCLSFDAKSIRS